MIFHSYVSLPEGKYIVWRAVFSFLFHLNNLWEQKFGTYHPNDISKNLDKEYMIWYDMYIMGKSTINGNSRFNSYVSHNQRVYDMYIIWPALPMILNNCPPLISICRLSHPSLRIGTILKIGYRRKTKNPSDRKLNPIEQTSRGPSGKRLHNYGKIHHFLMSKSTINGPFSLAMLNYQRVNDFWIFFGVAESPIPPKKIRTE